MPTPRWRPLLAVLALLLAVPVASSADDPHGLKGEYFANETLTGTPTAERTDATVDFAWEGTAPAADVPSHEFSVRWTGTITPRYSERYTLHTRTDDGVRLWIDDTLVIDDWNRHSAKDNTGEIDLVAGRAHRIRMEFYEHHGRAEARLGWQSASQAREIVPTERLAPPATVPVVPAGTTTQAVVEALPPAVTTISEAMPPASALPAIEPPVAGQTFNAGPVVGEVMVRRPDDGALVPLDGAASLPVGTRIDTREGAVAIQTAPADGVARPTQDVVFEGSMFRVTQSRRGKRIVGIDLSHGDFEDCAALPRRARARTAAAARGRDKQVRRLFGKGKGKFRTKGRFAAATVRGTAWTIADTCDETITRVHEGIVDVENLITGRTVAVEAGERYAARGRRR